MILADQLQRDRLTTDLDANLFVEAAAGSGKTEAVVQRVVAAVASGRLEMERLVAITFTIAAAGELRVRIRQGLELSAVDATRSNLQRERCARAASQVERARIETIHAFCSTLLRMNPLEAGLPPDFEPFDELGAEIDARERFRSWFDGLHAEHADAVAVRRGLLLGIRPSDLMKAFTVLNGNWDLLEAPPHWAGTIPPDLVQHGRTIGSELQADVDLLDQCHAPDALHANLGALQPMAGELRRATTIDEALRVLSAVDRTIRPHAGSQTNWAKDVCATIKASLKDVRVRVESLLAVSREAVTADVVRTLRQLVLDYAEERRARGVVTFQDLLARSRTLARDNPAVRDMLRRRWDLIILDEFQDTDPLQAELAFLLAAQPGATADSWTDLPLRPGALCLVGDPKQSIYRFRRADISLYAAVKRARMAADPRSQVTLQVNFRSGQSIVDAVNTVFGGEDGLMSSTDEAVQAPYIELIGHAPEVSGTVHTFGDAVDDSAPEMWRQEAQATAAVITRILVEQWPVDQGREASVRPCEMSDVCILMPSRTNLRNLERALEDARIRYRLESGALMIATQEVRDLLNCLRAIDDPTDEVALVATLRSPAYGCSDVELMTWREGGGRWSYLRAPDGGRGRVALAMAELKALHEDRHRLSPPALVEELISRRLLRAAAADAWRPREILRRQRYVLDQVTVIGRTGRKTLHDAVEYLERLASSPHYDSVATGGDGEDCVRVMTIHAAKGLEFPVTIVTGLGAKPREQAHPLVLDRATGRVDLLLKEGFATSGWKAMNDREQEMKVAERRRLLYVALTRARDHLVVSRYRTARAGEKTDAHAVAERLSLVGNVEQLALDTAGRLPVATTAPVTIELDPDVHIADEEAWSVRRSQLLDEFGLLRVRSATGLAHEPDRPDALSGEDVAVQRRGRGGTSVGRAVHAVLQVINLQTLDGVSTHAAAQAAAEGIPDRAVDVERLVRAACATDAVQRAARSRHWRELPLGARVDGCVLEGFVDLLYEDPDGRLVVLDYKTDAVSVNALEARMRSYGMQGGAYALLAALATGRELARIEFVFAAASTVRSIDGIASAIRTAREAVRAAAQP